MSWTKNWRRNWRNGNRHDWRGPSFDAEFGGTIPGGLATFALDLENGYHVRFSWLSGIIGTRSDLEQRSARNTRAKESYSGKAWLLGDAPRDVRTTLAKYAAKGEVFLLALPHEELLLSADNDGVIVYVDAGELALTDYARPGQRVVVYGEDEEGMIAFVDAVIQSVASPSITLDIDPGDLGLAGCRIAPAKPIYFDPEQDFARFETSDEQWDVRARATDFDFARQLATLALGPITTHAGLTDAFVTERSPGISPTLEVTFGAITGAFIEEDGSDVTAFVNTTGSPTSIADLFAALQGSTLLAPTGTWGVGSLSAGDLFAATALTGGEFEGSVGAGATLVEHDDKPVWDWPIRLTGSTTDSIHALTKIIDLGGKPYAKGFADMPAWGRAVAMRAQDRYSWQWFKLFMTTVRGSAKSWWLPSYRDDLPFVSKATNTITVAADVDAYYPVQRQHVQILETSGTVTRAEITQAVNNGDGTWTLTIGTTLASSSVRMVMWLELCRWERDEFDVEFTQHGFSFATVARVVQA